MTFLLRFGLPIPRGDVDAETVTRDHAIGSHDDDDLAFKIHASGAAGQTNFSAWQEDARERLKKDYGFRRNRVPKFLGVGRVVPSDPENRPNGYREARYE